MRKNGHNGEGLPARLAVFMASHLMMPEVQDYPRLPCQPDVNLTGQPDTPDTPPETCQGKALKAMLDAGMTFDEAARIVSLSGETSTRQVCDPVPAPTTDGMAKNRREWDRKYRREKRAKERAKRESEKASTQTSTRSADTQNRDISIEDKIDTEEGIKERKKVRASVLYSKEFDSFWLSYPRHPGMGKFDAWKVWQKLPAEERSLAAEAVPKFVAWLKTQKADYPVVHACRFLSKKRFDGFQTAPLAAADFNSEEYQAARRRALDAIKGT